ncbi:MAG TPA: radical SAM protein [Verrucomicrobiae bacterium]|nr:radical SAM protein [Verrucomicrobiae bacterium]
MQLLPSIFRSRNPQPIRRPDFVETQGGLALQIWGEEGYWHVVDHEFADVLEQLAEVRDIELLLAGRPDWRPHTQAIRRQLGVMRKAGIGGQAPRLNASAIENVTINLTMGCNLHCRSCYVPEDFRSVATRINPSRSLAFLDDLQPCFSPNATITLLGGEPFLHPSALREIGSWALQRNLPCNVSTNGTVLNDAILKILQDMRLDVQVSLDGATAQTNDAIRGAGTFSKATASVRRLVEAGIPVTLCMVCCEQNLLEIGSYFHLATRLGARDVRFIPLKKLGTSSKGSLKPASQLEIVKAICRELDEEPAFRPMCRTDVYSIVKAMLRDSSRRTTCGTGTQTLLIHADGTVFPCINTTIPTLALGSVHEGSREVLARGAAFGARLSLDSAAHPCHGCSVKRWCLAVCPGETLQREGSLDQPHWNCTTHATPSGS